MIIGPFKTLEHLGGGGMGAVFLAVDSRTNQQVALKKVPNHPDSEAQAILAMEERGARLLDLFSKECRRVPQVFDYGRLDGCFYVSMEYVGGEDLAQLIARGRLPISRVCEIGRELCCFLEEAHGFETVDNGASYHSLVHGDLTAKNIRITPDGQVKVVDFGIAKGLSRTRTVNSYGNFEYLPPERLGLTPEGMVDASTDRWAIGVLLYEMANGRRPFRGHSPVDLKKLILLGPPPPAIDVVYPTGFHAIIAKLLAAAPDERYASATAIRLDLEACCAGTQTQAEREGPPRVAVDEAATRRTIPPADTPPTQRTRPPALPAAAPAALSATPSAAPSAALSPALPPALPTTAQPRAISRLLPAGLATWRRRVADGRWRRPAAALAFLLAVMLAGNEMGVAREAATVARQVAGHRLENLAGAWDAYAELADRSHLGFATERLRSALTRKTQGTAADVIAAYRQSAIVHGRRWTMVRDALAAAVAANPGDAQLRAARRYAEGHLRRQNGEARINENNTTAAEQELNAAVSEFRAAAELQPRWADPFLGLFRTFVIGLGDIERGLDALTRAEALGYVRTPREIAQLAQGYEQRGRTLEMLAREAPPTLPGDDYLSQAAQAYRQSLALYASVPVYGNSMQKIRRLGERLDRIDQLMAEPFEPTTVGMQ
jgi:serine/threonine protein kinase